MIGERLRVLLIDDEGSLREPLARRLRDEYGYEVDTAATAAEARRLVARAGQPYDVALIDDLLTPEPDREPKPLGIELVGYIRGRCPETECLVFTGWGMEREVPALQAGAYRYLAKPFRYEELAMLIRSAAYQVRLRAIGRAILSERNLDRVLEGITGAARSLALADEAAIVLLDQATGRLRMRATTHAADRQWKKHFKTQNLSREIVRGGQVVRVTDTEQDSRVNREVVDTGIRSFVGLPIPGEAGNLGVLYVYSRRPGRFEEGGTVAVLQTLAWQAGLAIANAQAFHQLDTHARYMEALVRAGEGLTRTTRLEDQLALAWEFVREQLQVSTFFVALYDHPTGTLGFPLAYDKGRRIEIPDRHLGEDRATWGVAGYVVKSGQEILWSTRQEAQDQCRSLGLESIQIGEPCQSCLYLPLQVGGEVRGVISIQSYTPHAFTPILLDAFRALGSQLSVALENTALISRLVEAREWREALIENAFDAVIAIDRDRRITVFNRRAEEIFGWKSEEMIGQTVARLHMDVDKARQIFERVSRGEAISGLEVDLKHRDGTRIPALLSATLIRDVRGRPIGQAGFMRDLRQVHLFEDRQRALFRVSQAITGVLKLDEVLGLVVRSAVAAFPAAQGGSIHLYDERTDRLSMQAHTFDYSQEAVEASCMKPGEGITGWVFLHRQPAVVDDVQSDPRYKKIDHPQAPPHQSMICVPLRIREQVIGTLSLDNLESTGAFHADDLELLSAFADQAAIAIDNARRMQELEQIRRAAEEMSRALEPRRALQQIVDSAAQVLRADAAVIWSYDQVRDRFIPEELTAVGIPPDELERFREEEPRPGRTAYRVMEQGYLAVTDLGQPEYDFLGPSTRDLLQRIGLRSFQGIALRVGDERLGVLYVNYNRPRTFDADAQATLQVFAGHAALALKNARLLTQMWRTREAAGVIAGVTVQEDLNQTLGTIARHTQQILGSDAVTLYAYDEAAGQFSGWAAEIPQAREPDSARPPEKLTSGSVVWNILRLARPPYYCLAEDSAADHQLLGGYFVQAEGIRAAIGIQLRVGERKVGVMFVNFRSAHRFTSDEIATIQLFADQAAVAIRNAQLYAETSRLYKQAQLMADISREAARRLELDAFLQTLFSRLKQVFAERGIPVYLSLATYDDKTASLAFHQTDFYPGRLRSGPIPIDAPGIMPWVAKTREPYYAPDVSQDEHYLPLLSDTRSEMAVPILFSEQLLGVLDLESPAADAFAPEDRQLLQTLAHQIATTMRNVRQYEELKRTRGLVGARTALAWMGMASSAWRHAIDKHALTIREQVQLLRQDLSQGRMRKLPAQVAGRLSTIERLAGQILEKPLVPPLSSEEGIELVAIHELVGERARQLWENDPYKIATLTLDLQAGAVTVRASPEWLRRAFDIIVDNAVNAVAGSQVQEITIGTRSADGGVEIRVSDTGPGISREIQAKLGLEVIEKPEDAKGLGMGLLIAQTIVQTYGGEIRVASTGPTGTTMVMWLPVEEQARQQSQ